MEDKYVERLGKLMSNLHSLEFVLRAFLLKFNEGTEPKVDLDKLQVGDTIPVNSFTTYASLGNLVDEFNGIVSTKCPSRRIDCAAVDLRDMLAHGRVAARQPGAPMELLKFGKEKGGRVMVTHKATLDSDWFASKVRFVFGEVEKVLAASNDLGQNIMPRTLPFPL
ncbi:hypothetical protein KAX14_04115 [Candidatus Bipolaricaulota bacterium]|nr:hypothetical protein [Candidatus Bipolaricaulota bacterium]